MPSITMVCLAMSWRDRNYCIAGKRLNPDGTPGAWVRPVVAGVDGGIPHRVCVVDGRLPNILDILTIPVGDACPLDHQTENCSCADGEWACTGRYDGNIESLLDTPESLWGIAHSTFHGWRDKILSTEIAGIQNSLYTIDAQNVRILVRDELQINGETRRRARVRLTHSGNDYILSLTDRAKRDSYINRDAGEYHIGNTYLTISLGALYNECYYKLVAGVIEA